MILPFAIVLASLMVWTLLVVERVGAPYLQQLGIHINWGRLCFLTAVWWLGTLVGLAVAL